MSSGPLEDLSRLCLHTITTKPWNIEEAAKHYSASGVKGITVWRDALAGRKIRETADMLRDNGLSIVSLCRGGFFPGAEKEKRKAAIDDNRKAIEEAFELGTDKIVLVCGADPAQPLKESRKQIFEGISSLLTDAKAAGVKLAIEPLHPMYADTRSAINTMAQANDMAESIDSKYVGVAVDVYHLWWDNMLETETKRCGKNKKLFAFHVCDWNVPTLDFLNDRGLMGDGCINVPLIRSWVEETGFTGYHEVEVFSDKYWAMDQKDYLDKIVNAYLTKT